MGSSCLLHPKAPGCWRCLVLLAIVAQSLQPALPVAWSPSASFHLGVHPFSSCVQLPGLASHAKPTVRRWRGYNQPASP